MSLQPHFAAVISVGLLLTGVSGCAQFSHVSQTAEPSNQTDALSYRQSEVTSPVAQVWHTAELDLTRLQLAVSPGDPDSGSEYRARTTSEALRTFGGLMAVNGGFYAVPTIEGVPRGSVLDVMGTSISNGTRFSEPQAGSRVVTATLCIADRVTIVDGQNCPLAVRHAMSAGPLLVRDGVVADFSAQSDSFANSRHPRTAIGLDREGNKAWIVVVDGRQARSAGATLTETAQYLVELGADDAINLDGGGSSAMAMWEHEVQTIVVSVPIDGGVAGTERAVANHLLVRARD